MFMKSDESTLKKCLFFTSNRLSNILRRIANSVCSDTGIAVPYIYLLIIVNQYPEITINELSEKLDIAPSTCTRFVNALVKDGILEKKQEWKTVHVSLTKKGNLKTEGIDESINKVYQKCIEVMDKSEYETLASLIVKAADKLDKVK